MDKHTLDEYQNIYAELSEKLHLDMLKHIEEFAAAFVKQTMLPPDRIVMTMQGDIFTGLRIWFEEKKDNNG